MQNIAVIVGALTGIPSLTNSLTDAKGANIQTRWPSVKLENLTCLEAPYDPEAQRTKSMQHDTHCPAGDTTSPSAKWVWVCGIQLHRQSRATDPDLSPGTAISTALADSGDTRGTYCVPDCWERMDLFIGQVKR
jgi:hypothetical protein